MSPPPSISVSQLSFAYRLPHYGVGSFKESAILRLKGRTRYELHWALRDVSFEVRPGETFGVIGPNGAGKTTLLRLIARILDPTQGRVVVRGRVAAMVEIGAGFSPDLTGAENIVLFGAILGHDPRLMRSRVEAIADWADLTDFLDVPVRAYSSGMVARLAFAVATENQPDILLMDEILAVGDQDFRTRSLERVDSLVQRGTTVLLISQDLEEVGERANRVLWLDHGQMVRCGDPGLIADEYGGRARVHSGPRSGAR